ncbi:hypothetical protein ACLKA6_013343 [Drosophila palustris]
MKNNKTSTQLQQRNIKLQPFVKSVADAERKLNYLSESNHVTASPRTVLRRGRGQRSSDGGSGGHNPRRKHGKKASQMKLKDETMINVGRPKISTIANFLQSPRRNGLSPRDIIEEEGEEEDDDGKLSRSLQDELNHHLTMGHTNRRSQLSIKHMHRPTYSCSSCGAQFHIKSLLGAHRRTHDDDFKVRFRARRTRESNTTLTAVGKQCKFCDRYFDLERALHIHQLCHCSKITPQQRRKLGYTDLAHEKKNAPLPNFQRMPRGVLPAPTTPDPNMPYVALGPAAIKMIEQEQQQQQKVKRRSTKYTVKVAGPMGRWR